MKQKASESSPVRIRTELLENQIAAIRLAGGFTSDPQAINQLIELCSPVYLAVLEHQKAVLQSWATGIPAPKPALPVTPPKASQPPVASPFPKTIDPDQLDDF